MYGRLNERNSLILRDDENLESEEVDALVESLLEHHYSPPKENISPKWLRIMECITIANCMQIAIECQWKVENQPNLAKVYSTLDILFACVFTLDAASIWYVTRAAYWQSFWNIFDLSLTVALIADLTISIIMATYHEHTIYALRLARCVRIIRVVRVLKAQPEITILVESMIIGARTLAWLFATVAVIILFFSVVFVTQIDHNIFADEDLSSSATPCEKDKYFCDLVSAMASLLSVTVGGSWDEITYPLIRHQPWLMVPFLACFVLTSYGVVNIMIGVVIDCVAESKTRLSHETKAQKLRTMSNMWKLRVDTQNSETGRQKAIHGVISEIITNKWVSFPAGIRPGTVISYLKRDQRADLTYEDFVVSLTRLLFCSKEYFTVQVLTQQAKIGSHISSMHDDVDELKERMVRLEHMLDKLAGTRFRL